MAPTTKNYPAQNANSAKAERLRKSSSPMRLPLGKFKPLRVSVSSSLKWGAGQRAGVRVMVLTPEGCGEAQKR